jgi:hypothetical protein
MYDYRVYQDLADFQKLHCKFGTLKRQRTPAQRNFHVESVNKSHR